MGLFIREKKDGRRTAGYLVYLIGGVGAVGAVMVLHSRVTARGSSPGAAYRILHSDVASITEPAAAMAPVEIAGPARRSDPRNYRLEIPAAARPTAKSGPTPVSSESFNAITAALETVASPNASREGPSYPKLPPSFPMENAPKSGRIPEDSAAVRSAAPGESTSALFGYRDTSADLDRRRPPHPAPAPMPEAGNYIVPRGTLICACLLTNVDSGDPAAVIQFAADRTLIFNHRSQLPFGTRFLGRLTGEPVRNRLNLTADTILYPDGTELPVSANIVEADETGADIQSGLRAYYFPPPAWAQVAPYVSDFITGYLSFLESRAQPQLTVGTGGFSIQSSGNPDPKAPLYQASAQAIQNFTQARLKEIEQRYASHYAIPAGTSCWLQLAADVDLSPAHFESQGAGSPRTRSGPVSPAIPTHVSASKQDVPAN